MKIVKKRPAEFMPGDIVYTSGLGLLVVNEDVTMMQSQCEISLTISDLRKNAEYTVVVDDRVEQPSLFEVQS